MKYERNVGMKVFSKLYVGFKNEFIDHDGYDDKTGFHINPQFNVLGFAAPHEENAAGRKRQKTVDDWSDAGRWKQNYRNQPEENDPNWPKPKEAIVIDNVLAEGFTITNSVKRVYYGGGNVVFRVQDPRGFELEIQSQNLMALIALVGLEAGGLIPGKCCWGRDGAQNVLIHESSEEYANARMAAETIKPIAGSKDKTQVGEIVMLTNGKEILYLGKYFFHSYGHWQWNEKDNEKKSIMPAVKFTSAIGDRNIFKSEEVGYMLNEPIEYHATMDSHGTGKEVVLYRELKVQNRNGSDPKITVETALTILNDRRAVIRTISNTTTNNFWIGATLTKLEVPKWQARMPTQADLVHLKGQFIKSGGVDYTRFLTSSEYRGRSPIEWAFEHEGRLWTPSSINAHDAVNIFWRNNSRVNQHGKSPVPYGIVRFNDTQLAVTQPKRYDWNRHQFNGGLDEIIRSERAEEIALQVQRETMTGEACKEQLQAWYNAGKLRIIEATLG